MPPKRPVDPNNLTAAELREYCRQAVSNFRAIKARKKFFVASKTLTAQTPPTSDPDDSSPTDKNSPKRDKNFPG